MERELWAAGAAIVGSVLPFVYKSQYQNYQKRENKNYQFR